MSFPALAEFRHAVFSPGPVLVFLADNPRVLLPHPPGVGKTTLIVELLCAAETYKRYGLVLYAAATTELLDAMANALRTREVTYARLVGRPGKSACGNLDAEWKVLERAGLSQVGRADLCRARCPKVGECPWPDQLEPAALRKVRTLLVPQAYLALMVDFVSMAAGGRRVLVILDESTLLDQVPTKPFTREDLGMLRAAATSAAESTASSSALEYVRSVAAALEDAVAANPALARFPSLGVPRLRRSEELALERAGVAMFADDFRNAIHRVRAFLAVPEIGRWWDAGEGRFRYMALPLLPPDTDSLFAAAHLDVELVRTLFGDPRWVTYGNAPHLVHPETRFWNVRNAVTSDRNFERNKEQILWIAALLFIREGAEGRRGAIFTKLRRVQAAVEAINELFEGQGSLLRAAAGKDADPDDPACVPVLHYGMKGSNRFEHFAIAFCVTSYNVREQTIANYLNRARPRTFRRVVRSRPVGLLREMFAEDEPTPDCEDNALIRVLQHHFEVRTTLQAVGRTRPWSRGRLVVLCHQGPLNGPLDPPIEREFKTLEGLRNALGISSFQEMKAEERRRRVKELLDEGLSTSAIAERLGLDPRSVRRLKAERADSSPVVDEIITGQMSASAGGLEGRGADSSPVVDVITTGQMSAHAGGLEGRGADSSPVVDVITTGQMSAHAGRYGVDANVLRALGADAPTRVALAFGYDYGTTLWTRHDESRVYDSTTIQPRVLTLAWRRQDGVLHAATVRVLPGDKILAELERVLPELVVHGAGLAAHCLRALGWAERDGYVDTAELSRAANLGRVELPGLDYLLTAARAGGVPDRFAVEKAGKGWTGRLDGPVLERTVEYVLEDARVMLQLAEVQEAALSAAGLSAAYLREMLPRYFGELARMAIGGVGVARERFGDVRLALNQAMDGARVDLDALGVREPRDGDELRRAFERAGIAEHFLDPVTKTFAISLDVLERYVNAHPLVAATYAFRKWDSATADGLWRYMSRDERVHPVIRAFGAATGRSTLSQPALQSLNRVFRPLIVPAPGMGIIELDYSQQEVGIAAEWFRDPGMTRAYNEEPDVYIPIARALFGSADRDARDRAKRTWMAVIYGQSPAGLAFALGIPEQEASRLIVDYYTRFPDFAHNRRIQVAELERVGYAQSISGLRRYRASDAVGPASGYEQRWAINFPAQAGGADILRLVIVRLAPALRALGARIMLPVHDALVVEAPIPLLKEASALTAEVMVDTMKELFPSLLPRVKVNDSAPHCWNRDGHADSIVRFLEDPRWKS